MGQNPINFVDPMGLDPWVGSGPEIPAPNNPDAFGVTPVRATPENVRAGLTSGANMMLLNAHHYERPRAMKVYDSEGSTWGKNEAWVFPNQILRRTPESKWPTIIILNGCDSDRSIPRDRKPPKDKAVIVTTEMESKITNVDLQRHLPEILKDSPHITAAEALRQLESRSGNSDFGRMFRIWGNPNARF